MARRSRPVLLPHSPVVRFPEPDGLDEQGLVAIGGDLSPERLLLAYSQGIFPWYSEGLPPMWWSPDPRAIIDPMNLHVSKSLAREIRRGRFAVTYDRAFADVILECSREREGGTWLLPEMRAAYIRLHELGHAHSVEVWQDERLVGGLYGVQCGVLFAAESMFHRATNASKIALVAAVRTLFGAGIELFDVQFITLHLHSMGAYEIPRREYLLRVKHAAVSTISLDALAISL